MPVPESEHAPNLDEALATLQSLAATFLQGGVRLPVPGHEPIDKGDLRRPAIVVVDDRGMVHGVNADAERLLRQKAADVVGSPAAALLGKLPIDGKPIVAHVHHSDGADQSVWLTRSDLTLGADSFTLLTLQEHEAIGGWRTELRYRHLVEQIPAVVFTAALDGGLYDIYVSPQIEDLLGYSQSQWVADPVLWYERLHPDDRRKLDREFARGCLTGGPFRAECRFLTRDDKIVWVHGQATIIKDEQASPLFLQGVAFDITEIKRAEEVANASLREKETLLKEIHHRVKNNLQVSSSLLSLQADRIDDAAAKQALREGQGRIRSMALVHELLYRSKNLSRVDLGQYVHDLVRQLLRSHAIETSSVRIETQLAAVPLPIDLAVPCGLILNEMVSNALEHAFPLGRRGRIRIELQSGEEAADLIVSDDGVGMPPDVDFRSSSTLGLRLIQTLAEQISGELALSSIGGTQIRLRIPLPAEGLP